MKLGTSDEVPFFIPGAECVSKGYKFVPSGIDELPCIERQSQSSYALILFL